MAYNTFERFIYSIRIMTVTLISLVAMAQSPAAAFDNGKIAYHSITAGGKLAVFVMAPDGSGQAQLTDNRSNNHTPRWSPDGRQIAFVSDRDGNSEIYIMNADGSGQTRITEAESDESNPTWSPDGSMIAYNTNQFPGGGDEIARQNIDTQWGANLTQLTASSSNAAAKANNFIAWSPDGRWIAFESDRDRDDPEIYLINAVDGTNTQRLTYTRALDEVPSWSPDGKKILFSSDRTGEPQNGNYEIFIMNADGSDPVQLTDSEGQDTYPSMSPNGKYIVFESHRDGHGEIYRMTADGKKPTRLTLYEGDAPSDDDGPPAGSGSPHWSPR